MDKKWPSSFAGRVLTLSSVVPLPYNSCRRVLRSVAIFLLVFALFCFVIKSSMASRLLLMPDSVFPNLQDNKIRFVKIRLPRSYCKLCKISIFQVGSLRRMRVFTDFLFVVLVAKFELICRLSKTKKYRAYTMYDCFHGNGPYGKIPTKKEPIRTLGFTSRLSCHMVIEHNITYSYMQLTYNSWYNLKGHSQLAHMHIRYHFLANLHITEMPSIQFSTKYEQILSQDKQKYTQKQVFQ